MAAPSGQAAFRSSNDTVPIFATALRNGRAVIDLRPKEFEIRDNGVLQFMNVFEAGRQPITIAIMIDDSASMRALQPITTAAAQAFVDALEPGDRATIGEFSRSVRIHGALTDDRDLLKSWLDRRSPVMAGTALWDALNAGMVALRGEARRRVVLVLTDGGDNGSAADSAVVVGDAVREGVMVYAISLRSSDDKPSRTLRECAEATGGAFLELRNRDSLVATFRRVAEELHHQYLLGFSPAALDGTTHALRVRVKRRGISIRARSSYFSGPEGGRTNAAGL
jgi:Ca-activated chloride channel family protein